MLPQCIISDDSEGEMDGRGDSSYYSIKLINPDRKSEYSIEKWRTKRVFKTVSHLTTKLKEKYAELEPCRELRVGYMDPGHGWKGKQRWITCDEDINRRQKFLYGVFFLVSQKIVPRSVKTPVLITIQLRNAPSVLLQSKIK